MSGQTLDFLLTAKRNAAALAMLNADKAEEAITVRQNKYLNNLIEQDHRNIKRRTRAMLGFKSFRWAQTILAGIELVHMIRKGQLHHRRWRRIITVRTVLSVSYLKKRQRYFC